MQYNYMLLWFLLGLGQAYAQEHRVQLQAGWTVSSIQRYATTPTLFESSFIDNRVPFHAPFVEVAYEYGFTQINPCNHWQLSTGVSVVTLGSNRSNVLSPLPYSDSYLTLPILLGHRWRFDRRWHLTVQAGAEVGWALVRRQAALGTTWGNINAVVAAEIGWHRFKLGTRLQVGLTDYRIIDDALFRHGGLTTYISCLLFHRQ